MSDSFQLKDLSQLQPQPLWTHFAKICSIPHPSYHENQLAETIIQWARQKGLYTERDQVGNVLIRKAASAGFEQRKGIVLQAHLDMVPQKNNDVQHDFQHDPIRPYVDGEWVKAHGTTLGADNGVGLASVLAVLDDDRVQHGPLEALLTVTEETGMDGAFALQPGWLQGQLLINTDFEDEGQICVGCAGGVDVISRLTLTRETLPATYQIFQLNLGGLRGGHSGCDIHLGRGNAIKLLSRLLFILTNSKEQPDVCLLQLQGGSVRNAIPREASALLAVAAQNVDWLQQQIAVFHALLRNELAQAEPALSLTLRAADTEQTAQPLTPHSRDTLINLLNTLPNGVMRYSDIVPGVVETSLNVGVLNMQTEYTEVACLIRSLIDSGKQQLIDQLRALGNLTGAAVQFDDGYPGWQPDSHSMLLQQAQRVYQRLFQQQSTVTVIHAGLECGLFKRPYPHMDMISIGPTITGAHSPDERVNIPSVEKYWRFLCELLKTTG